MSDSGVRPDGLPFIDNEEETRNPLSDSNRIKAIIDEIRPDAFREFIAQGHARLGEDETRLW